MYRELLHRHRKHWNNAQARTATVLSLCTFAVSVAAVFYAIRYATENASNSVTDIVLSNIPVYDVNGLFIYGTWLLFVFVLALLLAHPKRAPFALYSFALFYFIRAGFISLTHIGPFPVDTVNTFHTWIINGWLLSGADLFFSGHVGIAFLLSLMFWGERALRNVFLVWSVYFAVVVLLGHLHYSIDVVAAFFITFTIFRIAEWLFPAERVLFSSDPIISSR